MATAYRLNGNDGGYVSAARFNDGRVVVTIIGEDGRGALVKFDVKDFLKYMTTLLKNWGK